MVSCVALNSSTTCCEPLVQAQKVTVTGWALVPSAGAWAAPPHAASTASERHAAAAPTAVRRGRDQLRLTALLLFVGGQAVAVILRSAVSEVKSERLFDRKM